ncbi:unnamed protein product [Ectocarpus sp. 12 AP-2014]
MRSVVSPWGCRLHIVNIAAAAAVVGCQNCSCSWPSPKVRPLSRRASLSRSIPPPQHTHTRPSHLPSNFILPSTISCSSSTVLFNQEHRWCCLRYRVRQQQPACRVFPDYFCDTFRDFSPYPFAHLSSVLPIYMSISPSLIMAGSLVQA